MRIIKAIIIFLQLIKKRLLKTLWDTGPICRASPLSVLRKPQRRRDILCFHGPLGKNPRMLFLFVYLPQTTGLVCLSVNTNSQKGRWFGQDLGRIIAGSSRINWHYF